MNIGDRIIRLRKEKVWSQNEFSKMRGKAMQHKMQRKMNAASFTQHEQILISKIRVLPPERLLEVEDFIDFLRQTSEDRQLRRAAARLSEDAFSKVWDNSEDSEYDRL